MTLPKHIEMFPSAKTLRERANTMKTLTLNFHNDGGHGWVACKKDLVIALGIADQISRYSYQRGGTAYLEEDCDMPLLMQAIEAKGVRVVLRDKYRDESPIRGYQPFSTQRRTP